MVLKCAYNEKYPSKIFVEGDHSDGIDKLNRAFNYAVYQSDKKLEDYKPPSIHLKTPLFTKESMEQSYLMVDEPIQGLSKEIQGKLMFTNCSYEPKKRVFSAVVILPDPVEENCEWRYGIKFDDEFKKITEIIIMDVPLAN